MKQQADQHRSERSFEVGDWVFLRLQPYKQISMKQQKKNNKLSPRYYGPYQIMQKIGSVAYKLEFPPTTKIHPVFHVSCLKKVIGQNIPTQIVRPKLVEEATWKDEEFIQRNLHLVSIEDNASLKRGGMLRP